jgi:hypothetical protein
LDFQGHVRRGLRVQRVDKRFLAHLPQDLGAVSAAQLQPAAGKRSNRGEREHGHQCANARGAQARVPHHFQPKPPCVECEVSCFQNMFRFGHTNSFPYPWCCSVCSDQGKKQN